MGKTTPKLFETTRLGGLELRNRLVRSATWEGMCDGEGRPGRELIELYGRLAAGGAGLIITGFAYVAADGRPLPGCMGFHHDGLASEMGELLQAVHQEGGLLCLQLSHGGGQARAAHCGGQPLAPSAVQAKQYPEQPREMTRTDIERTVVAFASAAGRARGWGFDAVQLLAGHGYLISQFLSPHTNLRQDGYGGDLKGRSRFLLEVLAEVKKTVGADFPVLVKLNGSDNLDGGLGLDEALEVARWLDRAGVSAIEVSGGTPASGSRSPVRTACEAGGELAYNAAYARAIRQQVHCPVMVVGGVRSQELASDLLRTGQADYITFSRPLVREAGLPRIWQRGGGSEKSTCISCNGCFKAALKGALSCVVPA